MFYFFFNHWKRYLCFEEQCWLFGLHIEPMCLKPHTFGIYVSQETSFTYACTQTTAYTCLLRTYTQHHVCSCVHMYTLWTKDYLAKFCYDRIDDSNFANKFVWVRKGANPHGPNKIWVPKFTPVLFDICVGSHLTWGHWCLDDGCFCAWWTLLLMHHLQGSLVGGPPWFGDIE